MEFDEITIASLNSLVTTLWVGFLRFPPSGTSRNEIRRSCGNIVNRSIVSGTASTSYLAYASAERRK
jgi:hypothetical protein